MDFLSFNIFRLLGNLLIRMISWRHAITLHTNKYYVMHPLLVFVSVKCIVHIYVVGTTTYPTSMCQ